MAKIRTPNKQEEKIIRDNKLDPREYGVMHSDDVSIRLLCYVTRDVIEIHRGDRSW